MDSLLLPGAARGAFIDERRTIRGLGMTESRIRDHQGVPAVRMFEKVEDAFLLHQTAGESKIRLAILHAIVAVEIRALELVVDVQAFQNLLEDIGHGEMLEDARLRAAREQP